MYRTAHHADKNENPPDLLKKIRPQFVIANNDNMGGLLYPATEYRLWFMTKQSYANARYANEDIKNPVASNWIKLRLVRSRPPEITCGGGKNQASC